jgi:hypothetical protein
MQEWRGDPDTWEAGVVVEFFRSYLMQVVTIHSAMFEKLLFKGEGIPIELAELFEDAGNTYLDIAERINDEHSRRAEAAE